MFTVFNNPQSYIIIQFSCFLSFAHKDVEDEDRDDSTISHHSSDYYELEEMIGCHADEGDDESDSIEYSVDYDVSSSVCLFVLFWVESHLYVCSTAFSLFQILKSVCAEKDL